MGRVKKTALPALIPLQRQSRAFLKPEMQFVAGIGMGPRDVFVQIMTETRFA